MTIGIAGRHRPRSTTGCRSSRVARFHSTPLLGGGARTMALNGSTCCLAVCDVLVGSSQNLTQGALLPRGAGWSCAPGGVDVVRSGQSRVVVAAVCRGGGAVLKPRLEHECVDDPDAEREQPDEQNPGCNAANVLASAEHEGSVERASV